MKNYCLLHGLLKECGIGAYQKMKEKTFVVCFYSLKLNKKLGYREYYKPSQSSENELAFLGWRVSKPFGILLRLCE